MIDVPSDEQRELYRLAFTSNCLHLIVRAYKELDRAPLQAAEEPAITGLLVKKARELTEREGAESWLEKLAVHDDPPQNDDPGRLGKSRPRIDIEFEETRRGRRPRFQVEAKRLYRSDSASEYFGSGGLGMFLAGAYASEWPSAGMLGYVQTKDCAAWSVTLGERLAENKRKLRVCADTPLWEAVGWPEERLPSVSRSYHERQSAALGRISIFHMLLDFSGTQLA